MRSMQSVGQTSLCIVKLNTRPRCRPLFAQCKPQNSEQPNHLIEGEIFGLFQETSDQFIFCSHTIPNNNYANVTILWLQCINTDNFFVYATLFSAFL